MRKPVTLIAGEFGSPHFGTSPHLEEAVRLARKEAPQALYIGAASGDDETFGTALCALIGVSGASSCPAEPNTPKPSAMPIVTAVWSASRANPTVPPSPTDRRS